MIPLLFGDECRSIIRKIIGRVLLLIQRMRAPIMNTATGQNISAQGIKTSEVSAPAHIRHSQNDLWQNWGRTARCQPQFSFYPQNIDDLIEIVHFARARGLPIRVAASGHSWSTLVPTD